MGWFHRALTAAALLVLAGCVTSAPQRWASLPERDRAVIFGAITADTSSMYTLSRYTISYRNVATGEVGTLSFAPVRSFIPEIGSDRGDPELNVPDRSSGRFFEVTLPAGEYEFFQISIAHIHARGSTTWSAKEPFSVPFKVTAGGTHYIGELRGYPLIGKSVIGIPTSGAGYFVVVNREARDTALLAQRRGAAPGPIINIVPVVGESGRSFMRSQPQQPFFLLPNERGDSERPSASLTQ